MVLVFERPLASPYEIIKALNQQEIDKKNADAVITAIHSIMEPIHETSMASNELSEYQQKLLSAFEEEDKGLENQ